MQPDVFYIIFENRQLVQMIWSWLVKYLKLAVKYTTDQPIEKFMHLGPGLSCINIFKWLKLTGTGTGSSRMLSPVTRLLRLFFIQLNKLFDLTNQIWRYIVASNLIGQIKQLVNFNSNNCLCNWALVYE